MIRKTFVMAAAVVLFAAPQVHANVITYYLQDVNLDPWGYSGTPTGGLMDLTGSAARRPGNGLARLVVINL